VIAQWDSADEEVVSKLARTSYVVVVAESLPTAERRFEMYEAIAKLEWKVDRHWCRLVVVKAKEEYRDVVANGPGGIRCFGFVAG
jgi:hypothetical protein